MLNALSIAKHAAFQTRLQLTAPFVHLPNEPKTTKKCRNMAYLCAAYSKRKAWVQQSHSNGHQTQ